MNLGVVDELTDDDVVPVDPLRFLNTRNRSTTGLVAGSPPQRSSWIS
jgi:hypothetical protein